MKPTPPYFSIVIPVKNEEKLLEACLLSVTSQDTQRPYEILLVDGGSTDKTHKIAKKYSIPVIPQKGKGKVQGIQTGIQEATGRIVCMTEADCVPPKTWLSTIDTAFSNDPKTIAISGFYTFYDSSWLQHMLLTLFWRLPVYGYYLHYGNHTLRASNCAVRKDILDAVHGLDTRFAELYDLDLALRLRSIGPIQFIDAMRVQTSCRRIKGRIFRYIGEIAKSTYNVVVIRKPIQEELYEHIR